jgi:hypothetical protein
MNSVRTNPGTFLNIVHNTVMTLGARGISTFFQAPAPIPASQKVQNNVVTWKGTVTATWESITISPTTGATISQNLVNRDGIDAAWKFVDAANNNFRVLAGSTLINAGADVGIEWDADNQV